MKRCVLQIGTGKFLTLYIKSQTVAGEGVVGQTPIPYYPAKATRTLRGAFFTPVSWVPWKRFLLHGKPSYL